MRNAIQGIWNDSEGCMWKYIIRAVAVLYYARGVLRAVENCEVSKFTALLSFPCHLSVYFTLYCYFNTNGEHI